MTKRRFFAPGYSVSTRGHSVLRRGTYGVTPRRVFSEAFSPEFIPRRLGYESTAEEYSIDSAVTNATSYSDASLYDTYDTASRSRGRDQALLQNATAAIVSSEAFATPKTSVAARRVARKANQQTVKPQAIPIPTRTEVASYPYASVPAYSSARPRVLLVHGAFGGYYVIPVGPRVRAPQYVADSAPRSPNVPEVRGRPVVVQEREVARSAYTYYSTRAKVPPRYRLRSLRSAYATYRIPRRAKAAIVASKVEVEPRRKRPRSKFAAEKLRTSRARGELPQLELGEGSNKVDPSLDLPQLRRSLLLQDNVYSQPTTGLTASRPPLKYDDLGQVPLPSGRRAIRDVEGFTKPRNLLSWQYRLDSRMDPADLIYKPGSFSRMREQVRDAHDKMDRHRQMLDRYLTDSGQPRDIQGSVQRKMEELERRDPGPVSVSSDRLSVYNPSPRVVSQYGMPPKQPVSELRRRLRRTVCRSRGDPNYYRDRE